MKALKVKSEPVATYGAQSMPSGDDAILQAAFAIMDRAVERGEALTDPTAGGRYCQRMLRRCR